MISTTVFEVFSLLSFLIPSSYLVSLTSLSNDEDKKLKLSLRHRFLNPNVINRSLFCAITSIFVFSASLCTFSMIKWAS